MQDAIIKQAPEIIPVLTDSANLVVNIILATITFLAVLVALFQEKIKDWFNLAHLDLDINMNPPDCHQIDLTDQNGVFISKCIYLRIRVVNTKGKAAKNVEIIASNLWEYNNNRYEIVKTFLPMNLKWSHLGRVKEIIPPKSFRFCDLGPIRPFQRGVILKLATIVQPNPVSGGVLPNVIEAGKYKLELLISGDNTKPKVYTWTVEFLDQWSNDETTMLERINIEKN
ncbi:MAG: hypothetical protein WA064_03780 [Candidatus Moraniibacteriota bacterium]